MNTHVSYTVNQNNRQHPGTRAVEPAANDAYAVRGRLYIALELFPIQVGDLAASGSQQPEYSGALIASANNQVVSAVQEAYYSAKGSHLEVVQAALQNGQKTLREINSQQPTAPLGAGIGTIALLGNRLVVATCGPILSLIASDASIQQFPSKTSTDLVGVDGHPDPEIQTYQRLIDGSSALFLGSSGWLKHAPSRELLGMVAHLTAENSQEAAYYLSQQSRFATIPGLFLCIEMASSSTASSSTASSSTDSARSGVSPATSSMSNGQPAQPRSFGGLPTSVHATTRSQPQPSQSPASQSPASQSPASQSPASQSPASQSPASQSPTSHFPENPPQAASSMESHVTQSAPPPTSTIQSPVPARTTSPDFTEPLRHSVAEDRAVRESDYRDDERLPEMAPAGPSRKRRASNAASSMIEQIGETLDRFLKPRDRAEHESSSGREVNGAQTDSRAARIESPHKQELSEAEYRESKGWSDTSTAEPLYIEPVPTSGGRARLFLTVAALIFVLVPVAVFASVMSQGVSSRAAAESMIDAAAVKIGNAEVALDAGNNGAASTELNEAQRFLAEAERLKGDRSRISQLSVRMQQNFQSVSVIVPFYMLVDPMVRFPADASPSRVMVVNQDVYILDRGRNHIMRFRLGPNGKTIPEPAGEVVLRQGDRIDGFEIGPLIDMAWQTPSVGNEEKANLIVLDSNNQVFRYNQVVDGPGRLEFGNQALWQSPTQIQSYLGRFYVADSGRGQIYRYSPGAFGAEPDEWLAAATSLSLSSLLSMVIDGDIWMLFSNGQLVRYNNGLTVPFALDDDVGKITEPVDMFIGDQEDSLIYIADAGGERILVYRKDGSYLRQHQADEGAPLRDLRGIFVDEITNNIYILTQSSLYQHPLSE